MWSRPVFGPPCFQPLTWAGPGAQGICAQPETMVGGTCLVGGVETRPKLGPFKILLHPKTKLFQLKISF